MKIDGVTQELVKNEVARFFLVHGVDYCCNQISAEVPCLQHAVHHQAKAVIKHGTY